jgi:hypothetical protein
MPKARPVAVPMRNVGGGRSFLRYQYRFRLKNSLGKSQVSQLPAQLRGIF